MPDLIIVPKDKTLDQVLSADQAHMLIIGSSPRATELAKTAAEISQRNDFKRGAPPCAVQVTSDAAVTPALRQEIGETPDPTIVTLKRDGTVVRAVVDDGEIDRIDLEDMFLEAGV
jgi:hypothetical protein